MAVCVYGATLDADTGQVLMACTVHCCYEPCLSPGEPASTTPLEATDEDGYWRALAFWNERTKQQRPLVMHHGSWTDDKDHEGRDCWCKPQFFPAVEVTP